jgi:deazaflavin-dependent oxidoreductase (nitroreductase family)
MARFLDALSRLGTAASSTRLGGVFYHVVCRRIDSVLIPLSKGRLALGPPGQTVLLTTTGARSGKPRKAAVAFLWRGDEMIVVASKGGSPRHPGWYHNLLANPRVRAQYHGVDEERVAREATGAERDELFEQMARTFSNFRAYQRRAGGRRIPVMLLAKSLSGSERT